MQSCDSSRFKTWSIFINKLKMNLTMYTGLEAMFFFFFMKQTFIDQMHFKL